MKSATHDVYEKCEEILRLAKWWLTRSPSRKRWAMQHGGVQAVAHETWLAMATGKPVCKTIALSTAVCKQTRWRLLRLGAAKQVPLDDDPPDDVPASESYLETPAERAEMREIVERTVRTLPYRERLVIRLRFGLEDGRPHTLEECGRIFRVTRERIRQHENRALQKLAAEPRRTYLGNLQTADW